MSAQIIIIEIEKLTQLTKLIFGKQSTNEISTVSHFLEEGMLNKSTLNNLILRK